MVECCESLPDDVHDCSFMHLMGGNMGFINPNSTRNLTFLFPNMYPINRRGDCIVGIWYRDRYNRSSELRTTITFNTYIELTGNVMDSFTERLKIGIEHCESPDLDPLNGCEAVDCHQKYNGERTYFSKIRKKCIPSPACYCDPNKSMPDVGYLPSSNLCRDLENPITEEDVRYLTKTEQKLERENKYKLHDYHITWKELNLNLRCHHGVMSNRSGLCICEAGWTSPPVKDNTLISSTLLFHQCTIRKQSYMKLFSIGIMANKIYVHGARVVLTAFGLSLLAIFLVLICFPSFDQFSAIIRNDGDDTSDGGFCDSDGTSISYCTQDWNMNVDKQNDDDEDDDDVEDEDDDDEAVHNDDGTSSVDTCYITFDKPAYSLYTSSVNHATYQEVIQEIVDDYKSIFNRRTKGAQTTQSLEFTTRSRSPDTASTCSNFIIENSKLSDNDEDDDNDSQSDLIDSNDSEWELHNSLKYNLHDLDEKTVLNSYMNEGNRARRSAEFVSSSGICQPTIEESSKLTLEDKNLFQHTETMRLHLNRELTQLINTNKSTKTYK